MIWVDTEMRWHGLANGKRGRSPTFSDNAVQFCLAIQGLLDLSLRRAMVLTKKLLQIAGLNWPVPDFSTVSRRGKQLRQVRSDITDPPGLHLLVDDGGIEIISIGDWEFRNEAKDGQRQWAKVKLAVKFRQPGPINKKGRVSLQTSRNQ